MQLVTKFARTALHTTRRTLGLALVLTATAGLAVAGGSSSGGGVPELDPTSLASAAALLAGGLLMLTDRVRRLR